jgi:hypothetical protein
VGIDPPQAANGNGSASRSASRTSDEIESLFGRETQESSFSIGSATASPFGTVSVPIELGGGRDAVAASFTLEFDASKLRNPRIALGSGTPAGSTLTTNRTNAGKGRIGVLVDAASAFTDRQIVMVTFDVVRSSNTNEASITFSDAIAARELSDGLGNSIPVSYADGSISMFGAESQPDFQLLPLFKRLTPSFIGQTSIFR